MIKQNKRAITVFFLIFPIMCLLIVNNQLHDKTNYHTAPADQGEDTIPLSSEDRAILNTLSHNPQYNELPSIPFPGFLKNSGQITDEDLLFYYSSDTYSIGFGISEIYYEYYIEDMDYINFNMNFPAAAKVNPTGIKLLGHSTNFFDENLQYCNVPSYAEIWFIDLYSGIDLRYYMSVQGLKYDFIVHPGADPNQITLNLDDSLDLKIEKHSVSYYSQNHPKQPIFQDTGLKTYQDKSLVFSTYTQKSTQSYGFKIASYDSTRKLIIDPLILSFSTYWGGGGDDKGQAIALDSAGNIYITGSTASSNFPIKNAINTSRWAYSDVFITKLNSTGTGIFYSTYIRGDNYDYAYDIEVDGFGNVFITGTTMSDYYPTGYGTTGYMSTYGNGTDGFVTKLNANGDGILFSTGLGGGGRDEAYAIAIDTSGNSYIYGFTYSADFPIKNAYDDTHNGQRDLFVTKFNANGDDIIYSTYIGGSLDEYSFGKAIAVDSDGNAYITGRTYSENFPTKNAFQATHGSPTGYESDAFVTKINPTGDNLIFSTFSGGTGSDAAYGIAVDSNGNVYVTGQTSSSTTFPITPNAYQTEYGGNSDGFITKFNATGTGLNFSTFLGGNQTDFIEAIDLDTDGNCYLTGGTYSADFPMKWAYNDEWDGNSGVTDAIVAKLDSRGENLLYSTYLKGDSYEYGNDITININRQCYVVGYTASTNFPTFNALNTSNNGGADAFLTKLEFVMPPIELSITSPDNNSAIAQTVVSVEWSASAIGGDIDYFEVFLNEISQGTTTETSWTAALNTDGYYNITVMAYDMIGNTTKDTIWVQRDMVNPVISISSPANGTITDQTSITVEWTSSDTGAGIDYYETFLNEVSQGITTSSNLLVSLDADDYYNITVVVHDHAGNKDQDTIWLIRDIYDPAISITSPVNDTMTNQINIIVEWTGNDAGVGIDYYEVFLNEVTQGTTTDTSGIIPLSTDGYYNITVVAYDKIGKNSMDTIWVQRDVINPIISIISPTNNTLTNQNTIIPQWTGSDIGVGIDYYEILINGISQGTTTDQSINVNLDTDGYYNITIVIYDYAGNSDGDTIWVQRDMVSPVISISSPANGTITDQTSITVEWTGSDIGVGVDYYEVFANNIFQGTTTSNSMSVSFVTEGNYNITIVVYDKVGNSNQDTIWVEKTTITTTTTTTTITTTTETLTSSSTTTTTTTTTVDPGLTPGFQIISLICVFSAISLYRIFRRRKL